MREVVSGPSRYLVNFLSEKPDPEAVGTLLAEDQPLPPFLSILLRALRHDRDVLALLHRRAPSGGYKVTVQAGAYLPGIVIDATEIV